MAELLRYSAFPAAPLGGNPAGVWLGDALPTDEAMQRIAADVGYSETAFACPRPDGGWDVRYFSPVAEVPFCGHATIATGVALAERTGDGTKQLHTAIGTVPVRVRGVAEADPRATLTSVPPRQRAAPDTLVATALQLLGWSPAVLDPGLPPVLAYAGAWHLVLAAADRVTLRRLTYDLAAMGSLMRAHDLTTLYLVWRADDSTFVARAPFAVGGVLEDPATGAAAAALGGYLRAVGVVRPPADIVVNQGDDMGRPSRLLVHIPVSGGIDVTGGAAPIPA